ncbi:MAG: D-Ala-D-Ala carboxypeptidase family metallohydrolase [Rubrivivax sp.]
MPDERLSPHFYLSEFTHSQAAVRLGLDNSPPAAAVSNLRRLAQVLESVRTSLGNAPILVSSGFRSTAVNAAVGGAPSSAHLSGCAVDFTAPAFGSPRQICRRLLDAGAVFDQLIFEGSWVHYAIPLPGTPLRRDVLTAVFARGARVRYEKGLA